MDDNSEAGKNETTEAPSSNGREDKLLRPSPEPDLTGVFRQVTVREPARYRRERVATNEPQGTPGSGGGSQATDIFSVQDPPPHSVEPGFTQMFQALGENPPVVEDRTISPEPREVFVQTGKGIPERGWNRPANHNTSQGPGEFTQLFQRIDEQQQQTIAHDQLTPIQQMNSPDMPEFTGGFTQLLRTLSSESSAEPASDVTLPVPYVSTEGPGEFTRIISRSASREAVSREGNQDVQAPNEPSITSSSHSDSQTAFAGSGGSEAQLLSMMANGPTNSLAEQDLAAVLRPAPPPPSPPAVASPSSTPQGQTLSKFQQYLPILLIGNLFLMLLVLILVVFLMLRLH